MRTIDGNNFLLTGESEEPINVNYNLFGLHKNRTMVKGELIAVEYYKEYDSESKEYLGLAVKEYRTFYRDSFGVLIYRSMRIDFYYENGEVGYTKHMNDKYASEDEAIVEGQTRRNNMISIAKATLLRMLKELYSTPISQYYAFLLLDSVVAEMNKYKEGKTSDLKNAITNSNLEFLTTEMKTAIVSDLTF